jgi:multiple sugar transport system permease protein
VNQAQTILEPTMASSKKEQLKDRLRLYGALAVAVLFAFFPIYWMLATSLKPNEAVFEFPPALIPSQITLEHYLNFASNGRLIQYTLNSIIVSVTTAVFSVLISAYAAYSFSKFRYRGRYSLMYLVLSAQMFPQALLLITIYLMFNSLGLLHTYTGLVLSFITFTLPLCIWMLKGYFDKIPTELIEAAKVDGANHLQILHRVMLPIAGPALVSTFLFAFIRGWNDFIFALTLAGPEKQTLPPGLVLTYIGEFQSAWADMMAASLLVSLPVVIAFIIFQRYIVGGLTAGAVKG